MSIRALFIRYELEKSALFAIHKKFYFTTGKGKRENNNATTNSSAQ